MIHHDTTDGALRIVARPYLLLKSIELLIDKGIHPALPERLFGHKVMSRQLDAIIPVVKLLRLQICIGLTLCHRKLQGLCQFLVDLSGDLGRRRPVERRIE